MPTKKTTSAQKKTAKKSTKTAVKKSAKKSVAKKTVKKTDANKVTKKTSAKKSVKKSVHPSAKKRSNKDFPEKAKAAADIKVAGASAKATADEAKSASIVFSFEDVERLMAAKKREPKAEEKKPDPVTKKTAAPEPAKKSTVVEEQPSEHRKLGAASLADILGFNPTEKKKNTALSSDEVPQKWKKYYKLLIELRHHVRDEIDLHSAETLKHSNRDDSGDLSGYGSHQADAGTDSFDRDFALSLVSNEHEALNEIEDAIQRIKKGTYGLCEVTGKVIPAARLTAVPFARYSVEGQAEYEKNLRRKVDRGGSNGIFGDTSDAPKIAADDDDE